jgi:hypothetical protein
MKNVVFYLTISLFCTIAPVLKGQVVLFTYAYESLLNIPEPGALVTPVFSIEGALSGESFNTGPLPGSCTYITGSGGQSFSHTNWEAGDAYRFSVDATGFTDLAFGYCSRSSSITLIGNFLCRVSCDAGSNWTTIVNSYIPPASNNFGFYSGSIPTICDEATDLWIEIYKADNALNTGTRARIDNVTLAGYAILPIELIDFSASEQSGKVELNWSTASETNNDYFSIQRSHDGTNFYEIGKIETAGNSTNETDYIFIDDNPLPGINYYRLHQVDFDGKSSNSQVKSVDFGSNATLSLFPSVTSGEINVLMNDNRVQLVNARVEVYDMVGQLLKSVPYSENLKLDVNDLTNGTYFVRLTDNQLVFSGNFIKI